MPKEIHIRYFARLREETQRATETVVTESASVGELFLELKKKYSLSSEMDMIRFALNQSYVSSDTKIQGGEQLVFIPPVAGG